MSGHTTPPHHTVYCRLLDQITKHLSMEEILTKLYSCGSISQREMQKMKKIINNDGEIKAADHLITEVMLKKPDKKSFDKFVAILRETNQEHMANMLVQDLDKVLAEQKQELRKGAGDGVRQREPPVYDQSPQGGNPLAQCEHGKEHGNPVEYARSASQPSEYGQGNASMNTSMQGQTSHGPHSGASGYQQQQESTRSSPTLQSRHLVEDDIKESELSDLAEEIGGDWRNLGMQLDIKSTKMDEFREEHHKLKPAICAMLCHWNSKSTETRQQKIDLLRNAVGKCHRNDVIKILELFKSPHPTVTPVQEARYYTVPNQPPYASNPQQYPQQWQQHPPRYTAENFPPLSPTPKQPYGASQFRQTPPQQTYNPGPKHQPGYSPTTPQTPHMTQPQQPTEANSPEPNPAAHPIEKQSPPGAISLDPLAKKAGTKISENKPRLNEGSGQPQNVHKPKFRVIDDVDQQQARTDVIPKGTPAQVVANQPVPGDPVVKSSTSSAEAESSIVTDVQETEQGDFLRRPRSEWLLQPGDPDFKSSTYSEEAESLTVTDVQETGVQRQSDPEGLAGNLEGLKLADKSLSGPKDPPIGGPAGVLEGSGNPAQIEEGQVHSMFSSGGDSLHGNQGEEKGAVGGSDAESQREQHSLKQPPVPTKMSEMDSAQLPGPQSLQGQDRSIDCEDIQLEKIPEGKLIYKDLGDENLIGEGTYGRVLPGKLYEKDVAVKVINVPEKQMLPSYLSCCEHEMKIMTKVNRLQHSNIVQFKGYQVVEKKKKTKTKTKILIVSELVKGKNLGDILDEEDEDEDEKSGYLLEFQDKLKLMMELAQALKALHEDGITHRDIKPSNILISEPSDGKPQQLKLCDLGLAKAMESCSVAASTNRGITGTLLYAAREIVVDKLPPTTESDIFAYGASMYKLFTGKPHIGPLGNAPV